MFAEKNNRKPLLDFLINRWVFITMMAASERVYEGLREYARKNNLPIPKEPEVVSVKPCRQIEIIKHRIIEILPEAHFISYTYEAQAPLAPNDFVELYIADHIQCAGKVRDLMKRMKIT